LVYRPQQISISLILQQSKQQQQKPQLQHLELHQILGEGKLLIFEHQQ